MKAQQIINILKEQKKKKDSGKKDVSMGHKWSEVTLRNPMSEEKPLVTEDELVNLVKAERKNKYNPYGENRPIASTKERRTKLHTDDVNGFGPKEYFKSLSMTESKKIWTTAVARSRKNKK